MQMIPIVSRRAVALWSISKLSSRRYASVSSSSPLNPNSVGPFQVFDRNAKRMQRDRSAVKDSGEASRTVDYVREEVADRMLERLLVSHVAQFTGGFYPIHTLQDIKRKFNTILDLGSGPGHLSKMLETATTAKVVMLDSSGTSPYLNKLVSP